MTPNEKAARRLEIVMSELKIAGRLALADWLRRVATIPPGWS